MCHIINTPYVIQELISVKDLLLMDKTYGVEQLSFILIAADMREDY